MKSKKRKRKNNYEDDDWRDKPRPRMMNGRGERRGKNNKDDEMKEKYKSIGDHHDYLKENKRRKTGMN